MRGRFQNGSLFYVGVRGKCSRHVVNFRGLHEKEAVGNPYTENADDPSTA